MSKTTDIKQYQYKEQLKLCLALIEDAHEWACCGYHDMVREQLRDILELFDQLPYDDEELEEDQMTDETVLPFPLMSIKGRDKTR